MRPLADAVGRVTGKNFNRKFVSIGRIVTNWTDIIGKELADKAQPVKIHYRKKPGSKKPEASLDIACSSSEATLLHYQKDLIIERINQIFGERWITAIRFVNIPAGEQKTKQPKRRIPLTAEEKNTLSGMLSDIEDDAIKEKLSGLGQALMIDEKTTREKK